MGKGGKVNCFVKNASITSYAENKQQQHTGREMSLAPFSAAFVISALAFVRFSALLAVTFS